MLIKNKLSLTKKTTVVVDGVERQIDWYTDHAKPVTRRDFLRAGLISGSALFALPTMFDLLMPKKAFAENIATEPIQIEIYMEGGSNSLLQTFGSRDKSGSLPSGFDYTMAGLATNTLADSTPVSDHGAEIRRSSFFYGKLVSLMGANEAKEIFAVAAHPANVGDDNPNNKMGTTPLKATIGRKFRQSSMLVEATATLVDNSGDVNESYVNTLMVPAKELNASPLAMTEDNSLQLAATPLLNMNSKQMEALFGKIQLMNEKGAARMAAHNKSLSNVTNSVAGGAAKLTANLKASSTLNLSPTLWLPGEVLTILDTAANFPTGADEARRLKHMLTAFVAGITGREGAIQLGGADHHNNQNVADPAGASAAFQTALASFVVAIAKTARFIGVNMAVTVITNGGMSSTRANGGGYNPTGDAGQYTTWAMFGRRANGVKPKIAKAGRLGHIDASAQNVSTDSTAPTATMGAVGLLVNALAAVYPNKDAEELIRTVVSPSTLGNTNIKDLLLISES